MRKKIVAGNWKMNKTNAEAVETLTKLAANVASFEGVEVVIGAPFTALSDGSKSDIFKILTSFP